MIASSPSDSPDQRARPYESDGWVESRSPAARLIWARDGREAVTAAVDLCRAELGSPTGGILFERPRPWFISSGFPATAHAAMSRTATAAARTDGARSAFEIGARVAEAIDPRAVHVFSAGRAALVVGGTPSDADERLVARVAAALRQATQAVALDPRFDEVQVQEGLAWAAHELKAPLGAVRAVLDFVVGSGPSRAEVAILRDARDEVVHLLDTVDPLLRLAAGNVDAPTDVVDLGSLARGVLDAESRIGGQNRRPSFRVSAALLVRADRTLLAVALGNLIRNALAHSDEKASVRVSVFRLGDRAVARVWDGGPGIPAAEREHVFARSVRGRSVGSTPGHGLGLFIARLIAQKHGGTLSLADAARGADFRLELPLVEERPL